MKDDLCVHQSWYSQILEVTVTFKFDPEVIICSFVVTQLLCLTSHAIFITASEVKSRRQGHKLIRYWTLHSPPEMGTVVALHHLYHASKIDSLACVQI